MYNKRIFLGGTCAGNDWRPEFIHHIQGSDVEYFNPVVEDWTPECQAIEEEEKNRKCNIHLYVLTPEMQGVYSIAEIVNSCWQAAMYGNHVEAVCLFIKGNWEPKMKKSLEAVIRLCKDICPTRFVGSSIETIREAVEIMACEDLICWE